jgi:AraC-like DNA-binding protein
MKQQQEPMANDKAYFVSPGWKVLLHDLGLDARAVLRRAELTEDLFVRDKSPLSQQEYFRLWTAIDDEADDPSLPLRIGAAVSVESFDPPMFAALCSKDLNGALSRVSHYKRLIAPMALHVDVSDAATTLEIEWLDLTTAPPVSLLLAELVFFVQLARIAIRVRVCPIEVISPILPKPRGEYTKFFGVPVRQGNRLRLQFASADASRPFLSANEAMWALFETELNRRLSDLTESATSEDRVHAALLELLPSGEGSMHAVAKKLGTSSRTLQRRLTAEGLRFQTVLDNTRAALAKHYLRTSAMSGAEISFLLGFEDPNSFFRAFNAWTGTTPERVRRDFVAGH